MKRLILVVLCALLAALATTPTSTDAARPSDPASRRIVEGPPVIGAVGDMACDVSDEGFNDGAGTAKRCGERRTSRVVLRDTSLDAVLGLGDYQYDCGSAADYQVSYNPTWGRLDDVMRPVVGNHEYKRGTDVFGANCPSSNSEAQNYFAHFGEAAHPQTAGRFSFNLGTWHLIALNANCKHESSGGCTETSEQTIWLKKNLAATHKPCILAFWHQPRFSADKIISLYEPWWKALYAAGADVVLNGHLHNFQRFARLDPAGNVDPAAGITEYIVGTGGENLAPLATTTTPRRLKAISTFGYLRMKLKTAGWKAEFIDTAGVVLDTSRRTCHT